MLVKLTGSIAEKGKGYIIADVGSLGYRLAIPENASHFFTGEMTLYLHEVNRDGLIERFAFLSLDALELFWKLIAISGVGPRIAQKIIFAHDIETVRKKIAQGELAFLTSISGVGKKTAQKIILELKGVIAESTEASLDTEAIDALVSLGYARKDAAEALEGVEAETTEDRIRFALQALSR